MNPSGKNHTRNAITLIDWNITGHHLTYLREYLIAFCSADIPCVVLSPEKPNIPDFPAKVVWRRIPTISWIRKRRIASLGFSKKLYANLVHKTMRQAEEELGVESVKVFFGCFHEGQSKISRAILKRLNKPAAGLYVQAGIFHSGRYLRNSSRARKVIRLMTHPLLEKIFLLDETVPDLVSRFFSKPVELLPDISDNRYDPESSFPADLGLFPKKRPILSLLGHLRFGKGVAEMIRFARDNPALKITFLLAGACDWSDFPPEEAEIIQAACEVDPRIVFHPNRISSEQDYNALIAASDLLWAAYMDSPHSSNTLAKAAFFEKPVLVSEGHLMAKIVREYGMGEVIPYGDSAALLEAVLRILPNTASWVADRCPDWVRFRQEKSNEIFHSRIVEWARSPNPKN